MVKAALSPLKKRGPIAARPSRRDDEGEASVLKTTKAMMRGSALSLVLAGFSITGCTESHSEIQTIAQVEGALPEDALGAEAPDDMKLATCVLWPGEYRGDCMFDPRGRGSFSLKREDGTPFYENVMEIMVFIFGDGQADVRSIDQNGEHQRWGEATRSESYPACWIGSDFSVCAY